LTKSLLRDFEGLAETSLLLRFGDDGQHAEKRRDAV
jgi:hypothetical protein